MIDWNRTTREETDAIRRIVKAARKIDENLDVLSATMDLEACHTHGCPLALQRMEAAQPPDLMHDIYGIQRHIDRETGKLCDCFLPRFAKY